MFPETSRHNLRMLKEEGVGGVGGVGGSLKATLTLGVLQTIDLQIFHLCRSFGLHLFTAHIQIYKYEACV